MKKLLEPAKAKTGEKKTPKLDKIKRKLATIRLPDGTGKKKKPGKTVPKKQESKRKK